MAELILSLALLGCAAGGDEVDQVERVSSYIAKHCSESVDPDAIAGVLVGAVERTVADGCTKPPDPLLLACIARYESGFSTTASNGTCRGLLQIHRVHRGAMRDMGLDYDDEADRLEYGCWLYSWHGLKPWTTRKLATRDYKEETGE